ncbi:hypothetical protein DV515_00003212 [Chloebia gouldiae]|uniref:Uncharacterized protein n=1 Tax=Chloebia gouldiae TaxID=44316 RepID=A0A3L8SUD9_CHLGU|nr:hypothetical protein DV515_00003212 [Chloebia gouldiae]
MRLTEPFAHCHCTTLAVGSFMSCVTLQSVIYLLARSNMLAKALTPWWCDCLIAVALHSENFGGGSLAVKQKSQSMAFLESPLDSPAFQNMAFLILSEYRHLPPAAPAVERTMELMKEDGFLNYLEIMTSVKKKRPRCSQPLRFATAMQSPRPKPQPDALGAQNCSAPTSTNPPGDTPPPGVAECPGGKTTDPCHTPSPSPAAPGEPSEIIVLSTKGQHRQQSQASTSLCWGLQAECDNSVIAQRSTAVPTPVSIQLTGTFLSCAKDGLNSSDLAADTTAWDCLEPSAERYEHEQHRRSVEESDRAFLCLFNDCYYQDHAGIQISNRRGQHDEHVHIGRLVPQRHRMTFTDIPNTNNTSKCTGDQNMN